jgi:polar amino acid transport system substrate-binding protein
MAVLLDNVIADRYGCKRAAVTCLPDDVARGTYAIGIRKRRPRAQGGDRPALAAMIADGELERILRKAGCGITGRPSRCPISAAAPPPPARVRRGPAPHASPPPPPLTLGLSVAAFVIAVPLGLLLAIMPGSTAVGWPASAGRGSTSSCSAARRCLLQLYVIYFGLGEPYYALGPITAAIVGLGLNYAAYEAEVYRGALLAIPRGQAEASPSALGHVARGRALRFTSWCRRRCGSRCRR